MSHYVTYRRLDRVDGARTPLFERLQLVRVGVGCDSADVGKSARSQPLIEVADGGGLAATVL